MPFVPAGIILVDAGYDLVLDLFDGSGSTLIACEGTRRKARIAEIDPVIVDVIVRRWQQYSGGVAPMGGTGRTFDELAIERGSQPHRRR